MIITLKNTTFVVEKIVSFSLSRQNLLDNTCKLYKLHVYCDSCSFALIYETQQEAQDEHKRLEQAVDYCYYYDKNRRPL